HRRHDDIKISMSQGIILVKVERIEVAHCCGPPLELLLADHAMLYRDLLADHRECFWGNQHPNPSDSWAPMTFHRPQSSHLEKVAKGYLFVFLSRRRRLLKIPTV